MSRAGVRAETGWYPEFMDRGRAERIHQQLAEIRQRGIESSSSKTHQFKLNPPIDLKVLEAFEEKHQVRLPEEYRDFLLYVGNGGAGPHQGLYSLEHSERQLFGELKDPNPFLPPEAVQPGWFESWLESLEDDLIGDRVHDGTLDVAYEGERNQVLLIVSGPHRGRIVYFNQEFINPPYFSTFSGFLSWYETWLREVFAGYREGRFGFGFPLDQEQSLTVALDVQESPARRKAALDNLLRVPEFRADQLALLHQAVLKESDSEFAADMFVCLAQNGGTRLEDVVWQLLRSAPSSQYPRLIRAMRDANIANWVEAAEWGVEQDVDYESVTSLLLDLERGDKLTNQLFQKILSQHNGVSMALYLNAQNPHPLAVPLELSSHADPTVRRYSSQYESTEKLEAKLPHLLELFLEEEDESVIIGWVFALRYSYVSSIFEVLIKYLKTEECHDVRSAIIEQLGVLKVVQAVPVLLESALDDNLILATNAVTSLGQIGTPQAIAALETVASADADSFRGTGDAMVNYPKLVIDEATKQLQEIRGAADD
jgi:HEAT repeats/SMI1 / KNR4 family (SUKH-1)